MLKKGDFAARLKEFIQTANSVPQEDLNKSIELYCANEEENVYAAIKSADIVIPPGGLTLTMSPSGLVTNASEIILKGSIK